MLQQSLGETVVWSLGPLKLSNDTVATGLTDADTYAWKIWPGDDQAALVTGTGTLRTETGSETPGFYVDVTITKADIAALESAIYCIACTKNPGTDDVLIYDDKIKFTNAPGSATALPVYCTFNDLVLRQSWVESLQDIAESQTGFAEQRHRARQWIDSCVMARRERDLESQYSRHYPVVMVDPIVPTDGADAGPFWGQSSIPNTTIQTDLATFQAYLDADNLMTGPIDNGCVADIAAWYTLFLIARPQSAGASTEKDWSGWAKECRSSAIRAMSAWTALVDTDDDGVPNFRVRP